jgi:hypothetical protein
MTLLCSEWQKIIIKYFTVLVEYPYKFFQETVILNSEKVRV